MLYWKIVFNSFVGILLCQYVIEFLKSTEHFYVKFSRLDLFNFLSPTIFLFMLRKRDELYVIVLIRHIQGVYISVFIPGLLFIDFIAP